MLESLTRNAGACDAIAFCAGRDRSPACASRAAWLKDCLRSRAAVLGLIDLEADGRGGRRARASSPVVRGSPRLLAGSKNASAAAQVMRAVRPRRRGAKAPGEAGWRGNGFAVTEISVRKVLPEVHPTAAAVARLAAPRFAAGRGRRGARRPLYLRDKVALTVSDSSGAAK